MTSEGGRNVGADLEAPVGALLIGARKVGRDRFTDEVVELGVGERRR